MHKLSQHLAVGTLVVLAALSLLAPTSALAQCRNGYNQGVVFVPVYQRPVYTPVTQTVTPSGYGGGAAFTPTYPSQVTGGFGPVFPTSNSSLGPAGQQAGLVPQQPVQVIQQPGGIYYTPVYTNPGFGVVPFGATTGTTTIINSGGATTTFTNGNGFSTTQTQVGW
jgi:hypothetical protein